MNSFVKDEIFRWSDGFAIGLAVVDDQHHKLVDLLNQLAHYHTSKAADERLLKVFDELVSYTAYHFGTEEALMDEFAISAQHATAHRQAHQKFVEQALAARRDAAAAPREVTGQVLAFLTNWLIQHILGMDRRLGEEVREARVKAGITTSEVEPPNGERTTEVLLDAIDRLYARLGQNTSELTVTNRRLQQELDKSQKITQNLRVAATAFQAQEGIMITDAANCILEVNKAFSSITGYGSTEVVGRNPKLLSSGRHDAAFYRTMWRSIEKTGAWQGEIWNRRKNGETYLSWLSITSVKDDEGRTTHYVGTVTDITEQKNAEDKIWHLAFYDQLTKLPNRRLMLDRLDKTLVDCSRRGRHGVLLMIDLDNFKALNDTHGLVAGDRMLVEVAGRLSACVRESDTVARIGGDEFVVILDDLDGGDQAVMHAERVVQKIQESLSKPYLIDITLDDGQPSSLKHESTSSIGILLLRDQSLPVDELMKRAETAMYQAKAEGRNTHRFFDPQMQVAVRERAALEQDLRKALAEEQFELYYQPQVDASGRVIGAEALVRWRHPERGMVSPADFIPLAEETGLILPIGHWVIATACRQLKKWADSGHTAHLTLAVNVSARQFSLPNFVEEVMSLVQHNGVVANRLKLELTESLLLENTEDIVAKMIALKHQDVGFAMDDFGTGYSSLSYLKRLPLDQLKIDQSFVRDILNHPNDAAIARTIVALAQSLGLSVIAEGVETEDQRAFLVNHGCLTYQGYLFSRPVPVAEFERLMVGKLGC